MTKNDLISKVNAHFKITHTQTKISIKTNNPTKTSTIYNIKNDNHHLDYNKDHPIKFACIDCKKNTCAIHSINKYHQTIEIKQTAKEILELFKMSHETVLLAQTQSGKSDVVKRILELFENNEEYFKNILKIESIVIILYASDIALLQNHQNEFYNFIDERNIIHIPDIKKITTHLINNTTSFKRNDITKTIVSALKQNCLIISDEAHADQEIDSIISKFRKVIGTEFSDYTNDTIKFLNISATAYEHVQAGVPTVILHPQASYYGIINMMVDNKIHQSFDLTQYTEYKDFIKHMSITFKQKSLPIGYYIIRVHSDKDEKILHGFIKKFELTADSIIHSYNMTSKEDINADYLNKQPNKITFIIIKGRLTKGYRIIKKYIIAVHDTHINTHPHTTYQGLAGRMTGYNANKNALIYCDKENIQQHLDWIKNDYDKDCIPKAKYINKNGSIKETSMLSEKV